MSDLDSAHEELDIAQCVTLACLLEATAAKPGNVHRGADFEDLTFEDFVASAVAIGPVMQRSAKAGIGKTILDAVIATRRFVNTNTNLGAVLLLAPLAAVPRRISLEKGIDDVLAALTAEDARFSYQAIRLANPGGLGDAEEMDVNDNPPDDLLAAMRVAAPRDMVARQFAEGFRDVLLRGVPMLGETRSAGFSLIEAIIHTHVRLMAEFPDSLIARKCGREIAAESARRAGDVVSAGAPFSGTYNRALSDLDFWLRADGHRRNPGTTADLIAASLFAAFRDGILLPPFRDSQR